MKPEIGRKILMTFFETLKPTIQQSLTDEKLRGIREGKHFTDLQLKRFYDFGSFEPQTYNAKPYYCLNFAMVAEDEETRRQALLLLRIIDHAFGRGEGVADTEKKLRIVVDKK